MRSMTNATTPKLSTDTKLNKENESAMNTKPPSWHKHVVNGWRLSPYLVFLMLCQTMGHFRSIYLESSSPYICQVQIC